LETFSEPKNLVDDPHYLKQRQRSLLNLDINAIDNPIAEIIGSFMKLPYCFTLQSCYGHFLYIGQEDIYGIERLTVSDNIAAIKYRIAYVAICIENSRLGKGLLQCLERIPTIDPDYIQFGCAEWFWTRQVNSYALQVEPTRYMTKDTIIINYNEALHIEKVRNKFFAHLNRLIQEQLSRNGP
jgi:hypothetical protein